MEEYKPQTIFDLLQEKTFNPFFDKIENPMDALFWTGLMGNVKAQIEYLKISNPAKWDSDSEEYKERMRKDNEPRPFIIVDVDGENYMIICTKQQLKAYYPKTYLKYFGDDEYNKDL